MIRTVTLNPAMDRTATIDRFAVGTVNRVTASRLDVGGKGINVSKAIRTLGGTSVAYGFLAGAAGAYIREYLDGQNIARRFVEVPGETRINLKIFDPVLGTHTDVNESGPGASAADLDRLEDTLFSETRAGDILVFSGSTGPGVDPAIYARWIRRAGAIGARTVLDADGQALRLGVGAGATIVKPNMEELGRLAGVPMSSGSGADLDTVTSAARALLGSGVSIVVVSLGSEGALFVDGSASIRAYGLQVTALRTAGAGDSLVAALCIGLERGDGLERMIVPAIAAATAAVATADSAAFAREDMAAYEPLVRYDYLSETHP